MAHASTLAPKFFPRLAPLPRSAVFLDKVLDGGLQRVLLSLSSGSIRAKKGVGEIHMEINNDSWRG